MEGEDIFLQLEILNNIKNNLLLIESKSFEKCIELTVKKYTENFDYKISRLINEYPENHLNKDGSKFWSGSKRFPLSIKYDADNDLCFLFIKSFSFILSIILEIQEKNNDEYISKRIEIQNYVQTNENNNKNNDNKSNMHC